jgi:hypothetical protein
VGKVWSIDGSASVIGIVLACNDVLEDDLVLGFRGTGMDDSSVYGLPSRVAHGFSVRFRPLGRIEQCRALMLIGDSDTSCGVVDLVLV